MFVEHKFEPNQEQQNFLNFLLGDYFPWFWNESILTLANGTVSNYKSFTHTFRKRTDNNNQADWGKIYSEYTYIAENIFWQACMQNSIMPKKILRSGVNLCFYGSDKHSDIHQDHYFPHNNFIMYLNDFTDAPTYIYSEDESEIIFESKPEKNKFLVFPGLPHAAGFCKENERRVVLVTTFI